MSKFPMEVARFRCKEETPSILDMIRQTSRHILEMRYGNDAIDVIVMKDDLYQLLKESLGNQPQFREGSDFILSSVCGIPIMTGKTNDDVRSVCISQSLAGKRVLYCYKNDCELSWHYVPMQDELKKTHFEQRRFMQDVDHYLSMMKKSPPEPLLVRPINWQ